MLHEQKTILVKGTYNVPQIQYGGRSTTNPSDYLVKNKALGVFYTRILIRIECKITLHTLSFK